MAVFSLVASQCMSTRMQVHALGFGARHLGQRGAEGVVEGLHEDPPLQVDHPEPAAVRRGGDAAAAPRRAGRVVGGAEEPRSGLSR